MWISRETAGYDPADRAPGGGGAAVASFESNGRFTRGCARPDRTFRWFCARIHPVARIPAAQRRAIPACHCMIAAFGRNDVPLADHTGFANPGPCANVARSMADRHRCLMSSHGATVLGETVPGETVPGETVAMARRRLEVMETLARPNLLNSIGGTAHILSDDEIDEVMSAFQGDRPSGPGETTKKWRQ